MVFILDAHVILKRLDVRLRTHSCNVYYVIKQRRKRCRSFGFLHRIALLIDAIKGATPRHTVISPHFHRPLIVDVSGFRANAWKTPPIAFVYPHHL